MELGLAKEMEQELKKEVTEARSVHADQKTQISRLTAELASVQDQCHELSNLLTTCRSERDRDISQCQDLLSARDKSLSVLQAHLAAYQNEQNMEQAKLAQSENATDSDSVGAPPNSTITSNGAASLQSPTPSSSFVSNTTLVSHMQQQVVQLSAQKERDLAFITSLQSALAERDTQIHFLQARIAALTLHSKSILTAEVGDDELTSRNNANRSSPKNELSKSVEMSQAERGHAIEELQNHHARVCEDLASRIHNLEALLQSAQNDVVDRDKTLYLSLQEKWTLLRQVQSESQRVAMLVNFFTDASLEAESVAALKETL